MSERLIYIIGSDFSVLTAWMQGRQTHSLRDADLVVLGGSLHVNPALYGEKAHNNTKFEERQDDYDITMFKLAVKYKKPILGIQRGAELATVLSGGELVQLQDNDYHLHAISTYDGLKLLVPSQHDQAPYPWKMPKSDYSVLACSKYISRKHLSGTSEEMVIGKIEGEKEIETIYYPKINTLALETNLATAWPMRKTYPYLEKTIAWHQELLNKFLDRRLERELKDLN